jgi:hypothetical protein
MQTETFVSVMEILYSVRLARFNLSLSVHLKLHASVVPYLCKAHKRYRLYVVEMAPESVGRQDQ